MKTRIVHGHGGRAYTVPEWWPPRPGDLVNCRFGRNCLVLASKEFLFDPSEAIVFILTDKTVVKQTEFKSHMVYGLWRDGEHISC